LRTNAAYICSCDGLKREKTTLPSEAGSLDDFEIFFQSYFQKEKCRGKPGNRDMQRSNVFIGQLANRATGHAALALGRKYDAAPDAALNLVIYVMQNIFLKWRCSGSCPE
jgi:hypothetical protein